MDLTETYKKDLLLQQLTRVFDMVGDDELDIFQILEDKPFVCGNQAVLTWPKVLRIDLRIRLEDMSKIE